MNRWSKDAHLRYASPTSKILIFDVGILLLALLIKGAEYVMNRFYLLIGSNAVADYKMQYGFCIVIAVCILLLAILEGVLRSDKRRILCIIRKRLCDSSYGNPLHMAEDEIEPYVNVSKTKRGFKVRIECQSAKYDDVASLETTISDCLRNRFGNYAVVAKAEDIAGRYVDYFVEDVISGYSKQNVYHNVDDIPTHMTKLFIRDDVYIDYSRVLNSSAIVAGRSRSGKTTAIISTFLLPILKLGRDEFGSEVMIVDPKSAELSLCPHVLSPDMNGSVEHILDAVRHFNQLRIERQKIINDKCKRTGKAHRWYDLGMKRCILFIDEFVSMQDMFPKKASKEKPDYSITEFQGLLRQIATQGASAGCFLILSTAEASVGTGGLESAINNACGIRILFKPSINEARYLWSSDRLEVVRERQYSAGDAWFSADDGINNNVSFVKFPRLEFGEYEALSSLLASYYCDADMCEASSVAKKLRTVPESD